MPDDYPKAQSATDEEQTISDALEDMEAGARDHGMRFIDWLADRTATTQQEIYDDFWVHVSDDFVDNLIIIAKAKGVTVHEEDEEHGEEYQQEVGDHEEDR